MRPSRKALRVLCVLTFGGGAALMALGLHVSLVAHLHASAAALAAIGFFVVLLSLLGFVGAGRDKSAMLMGYFFLNFLLLTALFVASYAAVAFQDSLDGWLKRHWTSPVLDYLRSKPCCADYESAVSYVDARFSMLGAVGFACVVLVLAAMYCVIRIVTVPIVMKNLLTVLNFIFVVLGVGIFAYGVSVKAKDELTAGQQWIAVVFIVVGTILFALSVVGIIGSRAKSRALLLIYIVGIGACLVALLVCAGASFSFSDKLAKDYDSATHSTAIACDIDLPGCTNCTDTPALMVPCTGVTLTNSSSSSSEGVWVACSSSSASCEKPGYTLLVKAAEDQGYMANDIAECGKCPQWTHDDVHAYLTSCLQLLGLFASIVCFFIVVGFAAALILRRSLAGYQTDSI